jgi:hypothetical protein
MKLKTYVIKYLSDELREIQTSQRNIELPELNECEKAVIYHYSENGYEQVNELLRESKGQKLSEFRVFFEKCSRKTS